ncbi:FecR family protein [Coprobacter tertius]|uniref:FecR domain-containing protein n=1 Tax=Coprobacter tertius TaxID=2944915 RepID=A0ABT1MJK3_9BACT|nr:FecR family protein [Coprobacter tertius]MCP9612234.1 FecR domain-containing protein [Coprobacter tertius]
MNKPDDKQIEDVLAGIASQEVAANVAKWFATKEGIAFLEKTIDKNFEQIKPGMEELYVNHSISSEKMLASIKQNIRKKRMRRILFRVAAVVIPFIILTGLYMQLNSRIDLFGNSEYEEIYVAKGERIQMVFQDGTKVYINSDTHLKYPKKFGLFSREIYLSGEAYFRVAKNKNRPFIVNLNGPAIHVLGTRFNVKAYPDNSKILAYLDKGKINFALPSDKKYTLKPGEQLEYDRNTQLCVIQKATDTENTSKWTQNIISFKDASLSEVIQILNRWYNVKFVIVDDRALNYSYTLTSENTLLEKVLKDLEKISPVRFDYDQTKKEVKVKMK